MRRMTLDLTEIKKALTYRGYTLNEKVVREAVKFTPRFNGSYPVQIADITTAPSSYAVICGNFPLGHFTDIAPWDGKRYTWDVTLSDTPSSSVIGNRASLYQLHVKIRHNEGD